MGKYAFFPPPLSFKHQFGSKCVGDTRSNWRWTTTTKNEFEHTHLKVMSMEHVDWMMMVVGLVAVPRPMNRATFPMKTSVRWHSSMLAHVHVDHVVAVVVVVVEVDLTVAAAAVVAFVHHSFQSNH